MLTEYISREAVMLEFAIRVKRSNNSDFAPIPTWSQAVQIVEDFPAADVVEVVRCRECKYTEIWGGRLECHMHHDRIVHAEEYCAWGKRKDGVSAAAARPCLHK